VLAIFFQTMNPTVSPTRVTLRLGHVMNYHGFRGSAQVVYRNRDGRLNKAGRRDNGGAGFPHAGHGVSTDLVRAYPYRRDDWTPIPLGEHLRQVSVSPGDPKERSAMSAARVIPFPQTARSHTKQVEMRGMVLLLGGCLRFWSASPSVFPSAADGPSLICPTISPVSLGTMRKHLPKETSHGQPSLPNRRRCMNR